MQGRYKRNFEARLCKHRYEIPVGSFVFLRKEQGTADDSKHKIARVSIGTYQVIEYANDTVMITLGDESERVSQDQVELGPNLMEQALETA